MVSAVGILTEQEAELLIADQAFAPGVPGFVGAAVDLLLDRPGLPGSLVGSLADRAPLRHGYMTARSSRVVVVSGPPSPGVEVCLARMADDLPMPLPLIAGHQVGVLGTAADPTSADVDRWMPRETAGIRVAVEAGIEGGGILGLTRRWALAHTLAPVLAGAFANAPLLQGRPSGWRSLRLASRRGRPVLPPGPDPRAAWTASVLDAPTGDGSTFRERARAGSNTTELARHLVAFRPPVVARGHLVVDVADRQPGAGWRVAVAVAATLLDDPVAAEAAEAATGHLAYGERVWERAGRDALTDPELAAAARECFVAAYAALARQGVARDLRDAVADFTERYVLRGRCPADDLLDRATARP
jgi:glutamate--cysteine ligase